MNLDEVALDMDVDLMELVKSSNEMVSQHSEYFFNEKTSKTRCPSLHSQNSILQTQHSSFNVMKG